MKKITLFFSAMAVATTAFAATPLVNRNISKVVMEKSEASIVDRQVFKAEKIFAGKNDNLDGKRVKKVAMKAPGISVSYKQPEGLFAMGLSYPSVMGFNGSSVYRGPAYKPLTWVNTSEGATEYEWEYIEFVDGHSTNSYASTKDLVMTPVWSEIPGPVLYGMDEAGNSADFRLGGIRNAEGELDKTKITFLFGGDSNQQISETESEDFGMTTYLYSYNGGGYGTFPAVAYAPEDEEYNPVTGLDDVFTTPEPNGIGLVDPVLLGYANFFDAPAAPYFISQMWCLMEVQAKVATTLEMNLYKLSEDGHITDELIASGNLSVQPTSEPEYNVYNFDLFTLDEDGLETDDPIVIDCAFVAELTFNKNDLVTINMGSGAGAQYKYGEKSPYQTNCAMMIAHGEELGYYYCPYIYFTDETMTTAIQVTDWMWMVDAVFPWMFEVNDKTVAAAPVEGGEVSYAINAYYDIRGCNLSFTNDPEWVEEAYVDIDKDYNQVVTFVVSALPEGVKGRSTVATLEGPAASIELTITQGEDSAVSIIAADKNAEYFDLQGRRVSNPEKGIYIKKTGNKAEKVLF